MDDIMKIVKSLQESDLLRTGVSKATKNEAKKQKGCLLDLLILSWGKSLVDYTNLYFLLMIMRRSIK